MIQDPIALAQLRQAWAGVEKIGQRISIHGFAGAASIGGRYPIPLVDVAHNLPFIHAFGVLNDALIQLRDEGQFTAKGIYLRTLLEASKGKLFWANYGLISEGVDKRNDVAHRGHLLKRLECWRYIKAVKVEVGKWGIA